MCSPLQEWESLLAEEEQMVKETQKEKERREQREKEEQERRERERKERASEQGSACSWRESEVRLLRRNSKFWNTVEPL